MANLSSNSTKTLVLVLDGFGFDPALETSICTELRKTLPAPATELLAGLSEPMALAVLAPPGAGVLRSLAIAASLDLEQFKATVSSVQEHLAKRLGPQGLEALNAARRLIAQGLRYAPWAAATPNLDALRGNANTWVTRTAGIFTGFDDMSPGPEVMGNSDTGHQQIFNLMVARQMPAAISAMVERGDFMHLEDLNKDLREAASAGKVVFKTLLSGEFGDDGYVHSAWRHLEAFFELYFKHLGLPASSLQLEIVLDGRDSPAHSSLVFETQAGVRRFGFLHKLRELMARYQASDLSGWILGRQFLDRDYKGAMIRVEYEALVKNQGRPVANWEEALALVAADHASGLSDPMVTPIVIAAPRPLGAGMLHFNAIFRSDRQEPITAALLGARDFLTKQATNKGKLDTWDGFSWLADLTGLRLWSMTQYHSAFSKLGCKVVYGDAPHAHNVLALLAAGVPGFRFLFLTEGVKEKHMGMFSRGRRSTPFVGVEKQIIIPSWGREDGVDNDNAFFKVPQMRHPEITETLLRELDDDWPLIAVNYPGADMIGHLIMDHFDAALRTLETLDDCVARVVRKALAGNYAVILTADHGNIDKNGPEHGSNDVLTTLVLPPASRGTLYPVRPPKDEARLFDISWTILELLDLDLGDLNAPPFPQDIVRNPHRLIGQSLVSRASACGHGCCCGSHD